MSAHYRLTTRDWILIFQNIAVAIESAKDRLNQLDGVIGDGDHGVSMTIGMRAVEKTLQQLDASSTLDEVFLRAGTAFSNATGGAIGPLLGGMWTNASRQLKDCELFGVGEAKVLFFAMEENVVKKGKARPGDKTLLDALHPAVESVLGSNARDLAPMLREAANAGAEGARQTADWVARIGRSSRLGKRSLGHEDAGANSMALILTVIADTTAALENRGHPK